ncbi:MAG: hypothetical protein ACR2RE_31140 [Geminicoccaceae bacterium]
MSGTRAAIRARSLVGLYREATIASLPIEEVKADLLRVGVDPKSSIERAKSAALGGAEAQKPALALVETFERGDDVEADTPDVGRTATDPESDLGDILARARNWPERPGTAGSRGKMRLFLKRRRGLLLGLGGSFAGIAASIFILFAVQPESMNQAPRSEARIVAEQATPTVSAPDRNIASLESDIADLESNIANLEGRITTRVSNAAADAAQPADDGLDQPIVKGIAKPTQTDRMRRSLVEGQAALEALTGGELASKAAASVESTGLAAAPDASVATPPLLPDELTGVFVVDAGRAPAELNALQSIKRDDRLAAKLGEASLRALGRKVLALVAFERDGRRVEAALVEALDQGRAEPAVAEGNDQTADAVLQTLIDAGSVRLPTDTTDLELLELSD